MLPGSVERSDGENYEGPHMWLAGVRAMSDEASEQFREDTTKWLRDMSARPIEWNEARCTSIPNDTGRLWSRGGLVDRGMFHSGGGEAHLSTMRGGVSDWRSEWCDDRCSLNIDLSTAFGPIRCKP